MSPTTILPRWLSVMGYDRVAWLAAWREAGVRVEVVRLIEQITESWCPQTGRQCRAASLSRLAEEHGTSVSAVKRALRRGHDLGLLAHTDEFVTFVPGKRSTTLRRMVMPESVESAELPEVLREDLAEAVRVSHLAEQIGPVGWSCSPGSSPPAWAVSNPLAA